MEKTPEKKNTAGHARIMVFGTFDILHKGHLSFFRQARKLAQRPFLVVSVARDVNVRRVKNQEPLHSEKQRLANVAACGLADAAVLGGVKDPISHILKQRPDIIALGYDQDPYIQDLQAMLLKQGLKVRVAVLRPYRPAVYKSSLIKRNMV